ncbi:Ig-like domain-containing protein [Vibrio natriegens]|uniref:Ig-like domain-containing protein n=1 Tax=Vibrio natriegens TaxID=691 RepID=UPI001EFC6A62|nr:Ig-like domain-containing protein [Vibrio natriegens]MCG9699650.1 Ig-like domain-containing protein [Vibrio natriegens]
MAQLFRDDEACNYFFEIMKVTKRENYIDELVKMSKEAESSKVFGYALYDSGAFPQLSNLSRDFFAMNYSAILEAMTSAGVFDSYILLIRQVLGESTLIFHEIPNPGHLSLKVVKTESDVNRLATSDEIQIATSSELGLLVSAPLSDYTVMQLAKTFEALCQPGGIYIDFRTIYPESILVEPVDKTVSAGSTVQYTAQVTYDDGTVDDTVLWSSSDISIATIDEFGLATALSDGDTVISASAIGVDSVRGYADLHVKTLVAVEIDQTFTSIDVMPGDTYQFTGRAIYSDGSEITTEESPESFQWATTNALIASTGVGDNGLVTFNGNAYGEVDIRLNYPYEFGMMSDALTLDVQRDYNRFDIVVGRDFLNSYYNYGVVEDKAEPYPGSFSDETWPDFEDDFKIALFARKEASYQRVQFFSELQNEWMAWDGIIVTFYDDDSSVSIPMPVTGVSGEKVYAAINPVDESTEVYDYLYARYGKSIHVKLEQYTPTAEEKAKLRAYELEIKSQQIESKK